MAEPQKSTNGITKLLKGRKRLLLKYACLVATVGYMLQPQQYLRAGDGTLNSNHTSKPTIIGPPVILQDIDVGPFTNESSFPYLSTDCWVEMVDNRRTFFLRLGIGNFPEPQTLRDFIANRKHPISLVINNNLDFSWPMDLSKPDEYELILREPNLHRVYAFNVRRLPDHPKVQPLPMGPKWQYRSVQLYGEPKAAIHAVFQRVSQSPEQTQALFQDAQNQRSPTVWVRPMSQTAGLNDNYFIENNAMKEDSRGKMCDMITASAPKSVVCSNEHMDSATYFETLKRHRFVIVALGNGLDTHSTWEALLAGCIPVLPHSPLDPMFDHLPVWLVMDWHEVTDESTERVYQEMKARSYEWDMIFTAGWKRKIYSGV